VRVGVIGCGSIGTRHVHNLVALGHEAVVWDPDLTRYTELARLDGVQLALSEATACTDVDAVIIATPAASHLGVTLRQLHRCKYWLIEKPLGTLEQLPEWRELRYAAARIAVGYNWRWNAEVRAFREALGAEPLRWLHFSCATDMRTWPGNGYADPLLECSHELDLARCWDPDLRVAYAAQRGATGFVLDLQSAQNQALIDVCWHSPAARRVGALLKSGELRQLRPLPAAIDQSYVDELQDFLHRVKHGLPMACSLEDGIAVLEMVEQAKRLAA